MPKGYWIARIRITEPVAYKAYVEAAQPVVKQFGGHHLVRGGTYATPEGDWLDRHVLIEFDDYQTALRCYESDGYQSAKALRQGAAIFELMIIEGAS